MVYRRYNKYTVSFEFDPAKSDANLARHGIDFIEAQALWADPDLVEIPARTVDEPRYLVVARIGKQHWSGVITYREERIRIISVRRSRQEEVRIYETDRGKDVSG
ncbi:MAG: BrnT family toxin [Dehalococcoidia bacterium]